MPRLNDHPITHAGIKPAFHHRLGTPVNGQTAIRILRFGQPARLDHLELAPNVYGRWVPDVPTHPAHLLISILDAASGRWQVVQEVNLPADPRIMGEGLNQQMSVDEMNEHFARVLASPPHIIPMQGLVTDHLRVECDREHPVWPSHGECNGGQLNVPFGILSTLSAHGEKLGASRAQEYLPPLSRGEVRPSAPSGMRILQRPDMLLFDGEQLSVGFSLSRPMLMHLGFDAHGQGRAGKSRLLAARRAQMMNMLGGMSGPLVRTLTGDWGAHLWHGEVSVRGNQVNYSNLHPFEGLTVDALFTVEPDRLILELRQACTQGLPVIEAEAWRLIWDLTQGMTGAMAMPTLAPGRNGDVALPLTWATDSVGCLSMRVDHFDEQPRMQVESYRSFNAVTGGLVLAECPEPDASLFVPQGERQATVEWQVTAVEPEGDAAHAGPGLASQWAAVFACFRPEHGGFSNNAASVNCQQSQCAPLEVVAHTRRPDSAIAGDGTTISGSPDALDLARFTIERALLDGGGYGYWRNLYMDSDPVLVSAAGRIHQARPDMAWLQRIQPGLMDTLQRMLGTIGPEGLVVSHDLSGNSGSYRWSSNAMDVVGFGHIDGYVNAWSYRALRNAAAMLRALSRHDLASRAHEAAEGIRAHYARALVNPETGWVAGWRSRDGQLHDYGFLYVNGIALALGLLEKDAARQALLNLEALRAKVGPPTAEAGLPCNLLPIRRDDHMLPLILGDFEPTFETYTDGSLSGWPATYYLRALSIYGLREEAHKLAEELDTGYDAGMFDGGIGTGHEFRSWDGLPTGYEGTLIGCFAPLYAIAIEQGVFRPTEPEWWPEGF